MMTEKIPQHTEEVEALKVVIIGAGIAGLALAYGLQDVPGVNVRIFEKREEQECQQGGYPIHLAAPGRLALSKLLRPGDMVKVMQARNRFTACHDGIAVINSQAWTVEGNEKKPGKVFWRMVQSPGEKCLIERQDLADVLRFELGTARGLDTVNSEEANQVKVEYGMPVRDMEQVGDGWSVTLASGERVACDLLIGADGMFSTVRKALLPNIDGQAGLSDKGTQFRALSWSIVNFRTISPEVRRWVHDMDGMNMVYGKGWSAAFMPLGSGTDLDPKSALETTAQIQSDPKTEFAAGADSRHSLASDRSSASTAVDGTGSNTSDSRCYIALTIPNPDPALSVRESVSRLPGASTAGGFLASLLVDPGFETARVFPLWTAPSTLQTGGRAVLVGDASHGMVPHCAAGASMGLKDAMDLIEAIRNHMLFGGDLDYLLDQFRVEQKKANDPIVQKSQNVLWISQGDTVAKRICRRVVFGALEAWEKVSGSRRKQEKMLASWKGRGRA